MLRHFRLVLWKYNPGEPIDLDNFWCTLHIKSVWGIFWSGALEFDAKSFYLVPSSGMISFLNKCFSQEPDHVGTDDVVGGGSSFTWKLQVCLIIRQFSKQFSQVSNQVASWPFCCVSWWKTRHFVPRVLLVRLHTYFSIQTHMSTGDL